MRITDVRPSYVQYVRVCNAIAIVSLQPGFACTNNTVVHLAIADTICRSRTPPTYNPYPPPLTPSTARRARVRQRNRGL